jgi:hypothetical protein
MRKYKINMITKKEFRVKIYSQVFHWMSSGYSGMKNFIPVYQIIGFPGERYNLGFVNIEFNIVCCAPTTYWVKCQIAGDYSLQENWQYGKF